MRSPWDSRLHVSSRKSCGKENMKTPLLILGCSVLFGLGAVTSETESTAGYSIINRIHLTGDGGWDCCELDEASGRLFISHDTQVQVVDVAAGKQHGVIGDTKGVHDIAFVRELNKAYVSNGKDTSVSIVDFKSLALLKKIRVTGEDPDGITYDPFSRCIFVFNGKSENVTVIDSRTDKVVATIALGGSPEFSAADGNGQLYVNLEDKNEVAVINTQSMTVEKEWPVAPAQKPCAMAMDYKNHRLFIGCRSRVMVVMNAQTGNVIASLPIGDHVDAAAFDPVKKRIFFSNGDGTVTVIGASANDVYAVVENIVTQKGSKTMALSKTSHHLYLPGADFLPAPAPTADNPKPRAKVKSGSFVVLDIAPVEK